MCCQTRVAIAKIAIKTLMVNDNGTGLTGNNSNTTSIPYITSLIIIIVLLVIRFKNISRFRYNN
jgi:hypothetical protein